MIFQEQYAKHIIPEMKKKFGYKNSFAVPRVLKVVLNTGFGKTISGKTGEEAKKVMEDIMRDLALIAGQKPSFAKSKKSIAGFKLRQGIPIGAKATLRGKRMYDFMERFVKVVLPRSRDFRGLPSTSFDKSGNLNVGIREHVFFPEVPLDKVRHQFGLQITFSTNAKNVEEGKELFKLFGFPLK